MWCEEEYPSWVYLGRKIRWVKGMNLFIKGAIKVAYRKIVIFHSLGYSVPFIILLDICELTNGATTGGKEVSILQLTVEVRDKQCDDFPFFLIKSGGVSEDTCFNSCTSVSFAYDFAFEGSYHIPFLIERGNWMPFQASYMNIAFDGHSTAVILLCLNTVRMGSHSGALEPLAPHDNDAMARLFGQHEQQHKTKTDNQHPSSTAPSQQQLFFFRGRRVLFSEGGSLPFATQDCT